jgi:hypothetical protein
LAETILLENQWMKRFGLACKRLSVGSNGINNGITNGIGNDVATACVEQ